MRRPVKITKSEILLLMVTLVFAALVTALHLAAVTGPDQGRYTVTARQTPEQSAPREALININTADAETLQQLPGIGPALAERIVADRAANGPYTDPSDLTRVSGIGEKTVAAITPYITLQNDGEEMTTGENTGG